MKAINKYIICEPIAEEIKTDTGLILSEKDSDNIRYRMAQVVSPGSEVQVIKEGDRVYYDKSAGFKILIDGHPYLVISERDVVVVL
jgi:co-chaperonin GroES (HSP10)